jgi:hypothetical protein
MEILAPVRRLRARRELVGARRRADAEIVTTALPSPRLAWRTKELCSEQHRRALAESLVEIARASEARYLPNASPLNRVAAHDQFALIIRLGAVLADIDRRVVPRGVVLVERLINDAKSPLYRHADGDLHEALEQALRALEGEP